MALRYLFFVAMLSVIISCKKEKETPVYQTTEPEIYIKGPSLVTIGEDSSETTAEFEILSRSGEAYEINEISLFPVPENMVYSVSPEKGVTNLKIRLLLQNPYYATQRLIPVAIYAKSSSGIKVKQWGFNILTVSTTPQ